jgi:hypothetical protein
MTGGSQRDAMRDAWGRHSGCLDFLTHESVQTQTPQTGGWVDPPAGRPASLACFLPVGNSINKSPFFFLPVGKLRIFNLTIYQLLL